MALATIETPAKTERIPTSTSMQSVIDSAIYETETYVTLGSIEELRDATREQQAIELATAGLLAAIRNARNDLRVHIIAGSSERRVSVGESDWHVIRAAADALEKLLSPEPAPCRACGGMPGGWDRPGPCKRCDGTGVESGQ